MEANEFIGKLKANGSDNDLYDLAKVYEDYKNIAAKLPAKDKGQFALNVLYTLCRNLDKMPHWRDSIDYKCLLTLSIECVRETRAMERADRVKTLACIYNIHKHVVKQKTELPPELVLKISFMPFEVETKHLLKEYSKTYWNIFGDRLTYIENMKQKIPINKLLPKLTEDLQKIINIYEVTQFCATILVYIVKKLHALYGGFAQELNKTYEVLFREIAKQDLKLFKALTESQILDIYVKLNDCVFVIVENSSKINFVGSCLDVILRSVISIVGHKPALFHCLQTFYLNSFLTILTNNESTYLETVLNGMLTSFETTERLGYGKELQITYPFLSQLLRFYIEFNINNINTETQEICLKIVLVLMKKLSNCNQLLKCDNCPVKSGLHDALRLSFLVKNFVTANSENLSIKILQTHIQNVIVLQNRILKQLKALGCKNYDKCFRKCQTDTHNTAIGLNKSSQYDFSLILFDLYIRYESETEIDTKNISRAFYNRSICELDAKMYEQALRDAFLSLALSNDLQNDKYMSLVMDIKAKELKDAGENQTDILQMYTVLDAIQSIHNVKLYNGLMVLFKDLNFCELLNHEYAMYEKLWPSIVPIAGVWQALYQLYTGRYNHWTGEQDKDVIIWKLYEIIIKTCSAVRTIHCAHFRRKITELLKDLKTKDCLSEDLRLVYATLLFLDTEYELAAASEQYHWKNNQKVQISDPDELDANRTVPQEWSAMRGAVEALHILNELIRDIHKLSKVCYLRSSLSVYRIFVHKFLFMSRYEYGLQLAYICCVIADTVGDTECYIRCAGILLYHSACDSEQLRAIMSKAGKKTNELENTEDTVDIVCTFMCETAMYYHRIGCERVAAILTRMAQGKILAAYDKYTNINLDISVGRLLEVQCLVPASGPSLLSGINGTQRHYLNTLTKGTKWCHRRLLSVRISAGCSAASVSVVRGSGEAGLQSRAAGAAAAGLGHAAAVTRALLYTCIVNTQVFQNAQTKVNQRIKRFLGLNPTNEIISSDKHSDVKVEQFSPKPDFEMMLENFTSKRIQTSPTLSYKVPAFKITEFLLHREKCACYACNIAYCSLIVARTCSLEATTYFKANEMAIARNYFEGTLKIVYLVEKYLKNYKNLYDFESFVMDGLEKFYSDEFRRIKVQILMECAFFELKSSNFDAVDDFIVQIHELTKDGATDPYLTNEIMNLMIASWQIRKPARKHTELGIEQDFENIKLSPDKIMKTPDNKVKMPKVGTRKLVKSEELLVKINPKALNLDDDDKDFEKPKAKKSQFKVPVPKTAKPSLELATPRPSRSKPHILITQATEESTPNKIEFFTPNATPEQFFTPMTSIKTYAKKGLRQNIVKNLEKEFATPKVLVEKDIPKLKFAKDSPKDKRDSRKVEKNSPKVEKDSHKERDSHKEKDSPKVKLQKDKVNSKRDNLKSDADLQKKSVEDRSRRDSKRYLKRATSPGKLITDDVRTRRRVPFEEK